MESFLAPSAYPAKKNGRSIVRPHPRAAARLRLVCFPHAGGTASVYHQWGKLASAEIEIWAVELPGHGGRLAEPAEHRLDEAVLAIVRDLRDAGLADQPFALFGHSLGALLAFAVAREFRHSPMLRHVFASGCHAPQLQHDDPPIHALPGDEFLRVMAERYGGIPDAIRREKDLLELLLPVLRADMAMVEGHRYRLGPPLPCPITVLAGEADAQTTWDVLSGWKEQTTGAFEFLRFPGGHFYLQPRAREVVAAIETRCLQATRGFAAS